MRGVYHPIFMSCNRLSMIVTRHVSVQGGDRSETRVSCGERSGRLTRFPGTVAHDRFELDEDLLIFVLGSVSTCHHNNHFFALSR